MASFIPAKTNTTSSHQTAKHQYNNWKIHSVIPRLRQTTLLKLGDEHVNNTIDIICNIIQSNWIVNFCGKQEWSSFLNSRAIVKEIEDSVLPIAYVIKILKQKDCNYSVEKKNNKHNSIQEKQQQHKKRKLAPRNQLYKPWTVLDLCSGKGFFAMLLSAVMSYILDSNDTVTCNNKNNNKNKMKNIVNRILMVDNNNDINWEHIDLLNKSIDTRLSIETNRICLYSESFTKLIDGLKNSNNNVFVVGTHLCKRLSARAVEVYNSLCSKFNEANDTNKTNLSVAFLLAPCCLPTFRGFCHIRGCNNHDCEDDGGTDANNFDLSPGLKFQSTGENMLYANV